MICVALAVRAASGLSAMKNEPVFVAPLVPVNPITLATAESWVTTALIA
jgi:hypothetical protein